MYSFLFNCSKAKQRKAVACLYLRISSTDRLQTAKQIHFIVAKGWASWSYFQCIFVYFAGQLLKNRILQPTGLIKKKSL